MNIPDVTIVLLGENQTAHVTRAILEGMGQQVQFVTVHASEPFLELMDIADELADVIMIFGAADEEGYLFDQGDIPQSVNAEMLAGQIKLNRQIVISVANQTGATPLAEAFVDAGALAYLAPERRPNAAEMALFLHVFLHELLVRHREIETAMINAHGYADAFTLYLS